MAGDWIKMRADLHTHPKVVRIASALKADRLRVIGALHAAWCLFDAHSEDGQLSGYTPEALDDLIGWPGFTHAMESVQWVAVGPGESLKLPGFDAHNGQSAKRRAQEADRKRVARKASAPEADKMRTREEKRREEKIEKKEGAGAPPARFQKPDFVEVVQEFKAKVADPHSEALKFWHHFESVGWVVGRSPMKNWKSAVAKWAARSRGDERTKQATGSKPDHAAAAAAAAFGYDAPAGEIYEGDFAGVDAHEASH